MMSRATLQVIRHSLSVGDGGAPHPGRFIEGLGAVEGGLTGARTRLPDPGTSGASASLCTALPIDGIDDFPASIFRSGKRVARANLALDSVGNSDCFMKEV